jgi:hypothetical protein
MGVSTAMTGLLPRGFEQAGFQFASPPRAAHNSAERHVGIMKNIGRVASLTGMLLLCGCGFLTNHGLEGEPVQVPANQMFFQIEALSLINTRKTLSDHLISWVTGKDCSTPRASREGVYCTDRPGAPPPPQQVYCYSTLARPSCYSQPYNEGNDHLIGFVPASAPLR